MTQIPLDVLKLLGADARTTQLNLHNYLRDETIDRAMKQIVKRVERLIAVAQERAERSLSTEEIEADGYEREP
ncbi:MAG TPA: hypothetical protein VKD00_07040 [Methyloceanibacter sp.]|nr:hypothetical protein [Methyloceanibacter sp.]